MKANAILRHLRIAPRKVRLVADTVRGLDVLDAQNKLQFIRKHAAKPLLKLLNSALANAEKNFKLNKDNLYILELKVDEGPIIKRWMPRAMGRASRMNKRTSHISLVLSEKIETKIKESDKKIDNKKDHKDIKIVKDLNEVKELEKNEKELKDTKVGENKTPVIDKKGKKVGSKRMFRRKSA
ncbi:MAG: 50S ribosomal protein L22 [Patescibacteria group bacterium]